ncbi:helix-turn-helix transcriptional regulator [Kitasatospora sp. GP82]|uniref:helix-turn-helix transcriptional regulator n=1 Tax=Kitasatospora sp. GP82 TaxID=3035089 RepID=UPI002475ACE8|nr:helix-turn-helix transcriptional regulator [Kitasatospora sp. GP82]MDH6125704.1 DNA-binding CsgD family transcriptional regulator [Kitasatospora sp. GP82]
MSRPTDGKSSDQALAVYQELRNRGSSNYGELTAELGLSDAEAQSCWVELTQLGLLAEPASDDSPGTVAVVDPEVALLRTLAQEQRDMRQRQLRAEDRYAAIEDLAGRYMRGGGATHAEVEVEVLTSRRRIQQALEDLSETVKDESASMHPGALPIGEFLERGLARDRRLLESGARVRAIYQQRFVAVPALAEYFSRQVELGVEVRLAPVVPLNMILSDRRFALLPIDPDNHAAGAVLARGSALVRSYLALYEYCWQTSSAFGHTEQRRGGERLTEQQHAAIRMLAAGMKDEKIARSLGVSLRTLSRLMSEVMQELGTSSRFEAGVRAARLGWLD